MAQGQTLSETPLKPSKMDSHFPVPPLALLHLLPQPYSPAAETTFKAVMYITADSCGLQEL